MSRTALFRTLAALLLGASLLAPAATAAPPRIHPATSHAGTALDSPWSLLAGLWSSFTRLFGEEGCSLDPNGRCTSTTAHPSTDNGCSLDPSGRCLWTPTLDAGCSLDPDGRCK